jgi:hypothetical protein
MNPASLDTLRGIANNRCTAWRSGGISLSLLRATTFQFCTTFVAGLLPPLRQAEVICSAFPVPPQFVYVVNVPYCEVILN